MIHQLKIDSKFYNDIEVNGKRFEVRRDDRGYQVGDMLVMREVKGGKLTGRIVYALVTYIHRNGLEHTFLRWGYCILGIDIIRWCEVPGTTAVKVARMEPKRNPGRERTNPDSAALHPGYEPPRHSMAEAYLTELVVLAETLAAGPDEDLVEVAQRRMATMRLLEQENLDLNDRLGKALERRG
jgi:hypothetical protein